MRIRNTCFVYLFLTFFTIFFLFISFSQSFAGSDSGINLKPSIKISPDKQFDFAEYCFSNKDYLMAVSEYKRFIYFFPEDERIEQAMYRIGMSSSLGRHFTQALDSFKAGNDRYKDSDFSIKSYCMISESYVKLAPVTVDILKLYDYLHINFQRQYMKEYGRGSKLGRRKEVRYIDPKRAKILPLTRQSTQYILPDGWLYPLLASFRILLDWPKSPKKKVKWEIDPFKFFDKHGSELVMDIVEQSQELGNNPNAAGKSRMLWSGLKTKVENRLLKSK